MDAAVISQYFPFGEFRRPIRTDAADVSDVSDSFPWLFRFLHKSFLVSVGSNVLNPRALLDAGVRAFSVLSPPPDISINFYFPTLSLSPSPPPARSCLFSIISPKAEMPSPFAGFRTLHGRQQFFPGGKPLANWRRRPWKQFSAIIHGWPLISITCDFSFRPLLFAKHYRFNGLAGKRARSSSSRSLLSSGKFFQSAPKNLIISKL